jgi:predicted DNA-binding transcriptional regulator AlpA
MGRRTDITERSLRLVDIAELLGVSKQRAYQLGGEPGFPTAVGHDNRGRLWDRRGVERWAKRWRAERPWR